MSRCSVGPLLLFRRVVVVQVSSFFIVVVRCSLFGVLLVFLSCSITQNFQDLVLHDVHSLTTAVATERVSSIYTISDGRGLGLQCRRR